MFNIKRGCAKIWGWMAHLPIVARSSPFSFPFCVVLVALSFAVRCLELTDQEFQQCAISDALFWRFWGSTSWGNVKIILVLWIQSVRSTRNQYWLERMSQICRIQWYTEDYNPKSGGSNRPHWQDSYPSRRLESFDPRNHPWVMLMNQML